jgi:hypothetical protein
MSAYVLKLIAKTKTRGATRGSGKGRSQRPKNSGDSVGAYFGDAWSLAKRTASGLNEIRKLINIEEKILETSLSSTTFNQTGAVTPISQIAQGLNFTDRVGDSIRLQRVQVKFRLFKNTGATQSLLRFIIFRDNDCQGATPAIGDVLQTTGSALAPLSMLDFLNRRRFAILRDCLITLNNTGENTYVESFDVPHHGHVLYLGTAADAASQGKGSLFCAYVSDEATNTPSVAFQSRLTFTDD